MRIATFNLQNLRLRHLHGRPQLNPAWDDDMPDSCISAISANADRRLTAQVLKEANADIVALQEVFDTDSLDHFHDQFLTVCGASPYRFRVCLPGNDGRGLNVAAISRHFYQYVKSHASATHASLGLRSPTDTLREQPIFRRDCLEIGFDNFVLFVCHFKSPYPDRKRAHVIRQAEARAVRSIIESRFANPREARWIVLGDFNEPHQREDSSERSALSSITDGFSIDLASRSDQSADWTYETPGSHIHSRPDRILISPKLGNEFPDVSSCIIRHNTGPQTLETERESQTDGARRPHASDHALVFADFPGL